MASLVERRRERHTSKDEARFGLDALAQMVAYGGNQYALQGLSTYGPQERVVYDGAAPAISQNAVVYAAVAARAGLFSEARMVWRRGDAGPKATAADVFTDRSLAPLFAARRLLNDVEMQVALSGNAFIVRFGDRLVVLTSQWCTIVLGSNMDAPRPDLAADAEVIGLLYEPPGGEPAVFTVAEFAHYRPTLPDPFGRFRGMSYLRPVLQDAATDNQTRLYLQSFYQNSATPNLIVKFPPETARQTIEVFRDLFLDRHQGAAKAYRTAFLGGGADPVVVGSSLKDLAQMDVTKVLQANICTASGVPDIILNTLSGAATSTYANYGMAMRRFADMTMRPMWGHFAEALRPLFPAPRGDDAELWYDVSGVAALQADAKDDAAVQQMLAQTMRALVDGGYEPTSVIDAVTSGDLSKVEHSGLVSVQLLPPGLSEGGLDPALPPAAGPPDEEDQ